MGCQGLFFSRFRPVAIPEYQATYRPFSSSDEFLDKTDIVVTNNVMVGRAAIGWWGKGGGPIPSL